VTCSQQNTQGSLHPETQGGLSRPLTSRLPKRPVPRRSSSLGTQSMAVRVNLDVRPRLRPPARSSRYCLHSLALYSPSFSTLCLTGSYSSLKHPRAEVQGSLSDLSWLCGDGTMCLFLTWPQEVLLQPPPHTWAAAPSPSQSP
jgi:hypothetical protein